MSAACDRCGELVTGWLDGEGRHAWCMTEAEFRDWLDAQSLQLRGTETLDTGGLT